MDDQSSHPQCVPAGGTWKPCATIKRSSVIGPIRWQKMIALKVSPRQTRSPRTPTRPDAEPPRAERRGRRCPRPPDTPAGAAAALRPADPTSEGRGEARRPRGAEAGRTTAASRPSRAPCSGSRDARGSRQRLRSRRHAGGKKARADAGCGARRSRRPRPRPAPRAAARPRPAPRRLAANHSAAHVTSAACDDLIPGVG